MPHNKTLPVVCGGKFLMWSSRKCSFYISSVLTQQLQLDMAVRKLGSRSENREVTARLKQEQEHRCNLNRINVTQKLFQLLKNSARSPAWPVDPIRLAQCHSFVEDGGRHWLDLLPNRTEMAKYSLVITYWEGTACHGISLQSQMCII